MTENRLSIFLSRSQAAYAFVLIIVLWAFAETAQAQDYNRDLYHTTAPYAVMIEANSGQLLYSKDGDLSIPPSSMAKMMTIYVAFDLIKQGQLSLNTPIMVRHETWKAWRGVGSTMFLSAGEEPTVKNLLHGIVTLSGNDASVVLAEGITGSEKAFTEIMNKTARKLGLHRSHFSNVTGMPDNQGYASMKDLATLARMTILNFPKLYRAFYGQKSYAWGRNVKTGELIVQPNRNPIIGKIPGADGLKTGHAEAIGYGFTGSAQQGNMRLIIAMNGMGSWNERISESNGFMRWGFRHFKNVPVITRGTVIARIPIHMGSVDMLELKTDKDYLLTIPQMSGGAKVTAQLDRLEILTAPILKGQEIAILKLRIGDRVIYEVPLTASKSIDQAGVWRKILLRWKALFR